jgi:hypothetical protein
MSGLSRNLLRYCFALLSLAAVLVAAVLLRHSTHFMRAAVAVCGGAVLITGLREAYPGLQREVYRAILRVVFALTYGFAVVLCYANWELPIEASRLTRRLLGNCVVGTAAVVGSLLVAGCWARYCDRRLVWKARNLLSGKCQECGYDLTGNVSGRCPECGVSRQPTEQVDGGRS